MSDAIKQLAVPIIQAPMAGGPTCPELVASVVKCGALGSFGFAYSTPETIKRDLDDFKSRAGDGGAQRVNCNFFVFQAVEAPAPQSVEEAANGLRALDCGFTFAIPEIRPPFVPDLGAQLEPVWRLRPRVLSFHFGIPEQKHIERAKKLGIEVALGATSLDEAHRGQAAGADYIVAQGFEAGGHRGLFDPYGADERLSTLDLLGVLRGRMRVPVVAAGGLMVRDDIERALQAGASAAQLGTVFLSCAESGASKEHKQWLRTETGRSTEMTESFSGRPARGIANRFIDGMKSQPRLAFPLQNTLTGPLRKEAQKQGIAEYQSLWAGMYFAKSRHETVAQAIKALS